MPIGNYNMVHTLNTHTYSQVYIHVENMNKILFSSFYTSSVLTVYFIQSYYYLGEGTPLLHKDITKGQRILIINDKENVNKMLYGKMQKGFKTL